MAKSSKRTHSSDDLQKSSIEFLNEIRAIQDESDAQINALNLYGTSSHHLNLPIALKESEQLLNNILEIVHNQNSAYRAHQCASSSLDYWSNTSAILTAQVDETMQLKYDIINAKNRLHDLIRNAYQASETLTKANVTHNLNRKRYDNLVYQLRKISNLRGNIIEIYNTSVIPKTEVTFDMIQDNHEKIEQDLNNIIRLKKIVFEINDQCAENLNNIRHEWLALARDHSVDLTVHAEEYAKLFQNTKNGAEVAMLAR